MAHESRERQEPKPDSWFCPVWPEGLLPGPRASGPGHQGRSCSREGRRTPGLLQTWELSQVAGMGSCFRSSREASPRSIPGSEAAEGSG